MVSTRGKTRTSMSNETVENALTEMHTSDSTKAKIEGSTVDTSVEEKVGITAEEVKSAEYEEEEEEQQQIYGYEESEIIKETENDYENEKAAGFDGYFMVRSEKDVPEDDETDCEDELWVGSTDQSEDIEENVAGGEEENVSGEYGVSEEEIEEQDGDDDGDDDDDDDDDEGIREEGVREKTDEGFEDREEEANKDEGGKENIQGGNETIKEGKRSTEEHNTATETNLSLKNDAKSTQKRRKKKRPRKQKKVSSEDKPESSNKKKAKKKVKSMGMIFMCSSKTKDDCYKYGILGLPESKKDLVIKIYSGMRLFLYDVDLKLLYGIYKAAGPGGYNIEPKAFKSQFPSQVRFTVLDDCLPLAEEKFKNIIKDNYFTKNKFDCTLNSEQVKELCKLFLASSKGQKPAKFSRKRKRAKPVRKGKASRWRAGAKRRLTPRDELQISERPHKRPREAVSPVAPRHRWLPPLLPPVDLPRRDPYPERRSRSPPLLPVDLPRRDPYPERRSRSPYRDRRNPGSSHRDLYRDSRYPINERRDYYREELYLDRQHSYRGRLDYIEHAGSYKDTSSNYSESRGRALYLDPRDSYRDDRVPYTRSREPYRDGPDLYLDRRDPYRDRPFREPYSNDYKRDLLPDCQELRDSYRREEMLDRRDLPLSLETRRHDGIGNQDSYAPYRGRLPYPDPIYSAEYPSRAALARGYRL